MYKIFKLIFNFYMNQNNIDSLIEDIKKSGKYGEKPLFTKELIVEFEKKLQFSFPEDYKKFVTQLEPDIVNVYFVPPYRYSLAPFLIIFATWTNDLFAFHENDYTIHTIQNEKKDGMKWQNFTQWIGYIWEMGNKPVNPE